MQHTHLSKSCCFLLAALLGVVLAVPVVVAGQEQELKTLKLVKTYQSEADVRAAYPEMFFKNAIQDEGDEINFYDPKTGKLLKQLKKEQPKILREEKHEQQTFDIKKTYRYQISPHHALMMFTEYEGQYLKGTDASEAGPQPQRRILYNRDGEVITELPPLLNIIQDSPDHNYFVAAHSSEVEADFLYFYDIQGHLLKEQKIHGYPGFRYSSNSEYVAVVTSSPANAFGEVYLFTKTGEFIATYDYGSIFHDNLFAVHVSDDAKVLLFSMLNNAYLISGDGRIHWQQPYVRILNCQFIPDKNTLLLYSMIDNKSLNESRKSITVVSLSHGELVDRLEDVELVEFTQHGVVLKREGSYYDYTVR